MNPINRVGQRVLCVHPPSGWLKACPALRVWPMRGEAYTVAGFETIEGIPGVHLREIAGVYCECSRLENAPWPLRCFRPLDERKTDIGVFERVLDDANRRQREVA
jgi:hypothetical protein